MRLFRRDHPQAAAAIAWVAEDGLSIDELSALLGRSRGATRQFLSQSRKKARIYLDPWYRLVVDEEKPA
jgi:DNA-directed RNA polymerase specialized sigma24 family protein